MPLSINNLSLTISGLAPTLKVTQGTTQLKFSDRFIACFSTASSLANGKDKVDNLYNILTRESDELQGKTGKFYLDPGIKKVAVFAKIRALADQDKQSHFKIKVHEGEAIFFIGEERVYRSPVSEQGANFINQKGTEADGTVKARKDILDFINPELQQHQQHRSATRIQSAFRKHQQEQDSIIIQARGQGLSYARKTYRGSNPKAQQGATEFWVSTQKVGPVLHTPVNQPVYAGKGRVKELFAEDSRLVALKPRRGDFSKESRRDNSDLTKLSLKTVIYNVVVDAEKKLIIARHAGEPLRENVFPPECFKNALNDLKILHREGIYVRDIKPANMAYDVSKNQINLIDLDDRVSENQQGAIQMAGTPIFTTNALMKGLYGRPPAENRYALLKVADEYAFLLSMLLYLPIEEVHSDIITLAIYKLTDNVGFCAVQDGVMDEGNKDSFTTWIERYIKLEYQDSVQKLLTNPADFATNFPDHVPLAEMIKYSDEVR